MQIAIVRYSHKHGHDIIPCINYVLAEKVACKFIREARDEFEIAEDISDESCLNHWYEFTNGEEEIEIIEADVVEQE